MHLLGGRGGRCSKGRGASEGMFPPASPPRGAACLCEPCSLCLRLLGAARSTHACAPLRTPARSPCWAPARAHARPPAPAPQRVHSPAELLGLIRWREVKPTATFTGHLTIGTKVAFPVRAVPCTPLQQ